jgi:hypothetical protein
MTTFSRQKDQLTFSRKRRHFFRQKQQVIFPAKNRQLFAPKTGNFSRQKIDQL